MILNLAERIGAGGRAVMVVDHENLARARLILRRIAMFRPLKNPTTVALGLCPA